ncbi:MAG: phosphotransferase [Ekhidna sp.]
MDGLDLSRRSGTGGETVGEIHTFGTISITFMELRTLHILKTFGIEKAISIKSITEGLINKSYRVDTNDAIYVLQCVNATIFPDPESIMHNISMVHDSLHNQERYHVPEFVSTKEGSWISRDTSNQPWRLMRYVENSESFKTTSDIKIGTEAGKIIGRFHSGTRECDTTRLQVTLPNFHNLNLRMESFQQSLNDAMPTRLKNAVDSIKQIELIFAEQLKGVSFKEQPLRVTHNDTKLSNILFDKRSGLGLCLIDLDTIMPGYIMHDFGDAIRTLCNTSAEDEADLNCVVFHFELFEAFLSGYTLANGRGLTDEEWDVLPVSILLMPFIMAVRFLTDYLQGDLYYHTDYSAHNLIRCRNQLKLITEINQRKQDIESCINVARKGFS